MALQAQLALKDAEVAAAAAQLDASGAGQAFTAIPVGLTRLNASALGSGDTGSQQGGAQEHGKGSAAVALSGGPAGHPLCMQHACTEDAHGSASCLWLVVDGCC